MGPGQAQQHWFLLGGCKFFLLFWEVPGVVASSFVHDNKCTKTENTVMQKHLVI